MHRYAIQKLDSLLHRRADPLDEDIRTAFNDSAGPRTEYEAKRFWYLAVTLCNESPLFRHAKKGIDLCPAIREHIAQHHPEDQELVCRGRYKAMVLEKLIHVAQKCDETERNAISNWMAVGSADAVLSGTLYPFLIEESNKEYYNSHNAMYESSPNIGKEHQDSKEESRSVHVQQEKPSKRAPKNGLIAHLQAAEEKGKAKEVAQKPKKKEVLMGSGWTMEI